MALSDLVNVNISATETGLTRENFGIPLVAAYHDEDIDTVASFASLREAELAGITADDYPVAYGLLAACFQQKRRPKRVKLGKRSAWVQIIRLTPDAPSALEDFSGTIDGTAFTAAADGTPSVAEVCTALATAINAMNLTPSDVTASGASGTHVDVTSASGVFHEFTVTTGNMTIKDVTADTGLDADLATFEAEDSDWYGLVFDVTNSTDIADAALWCSTRRKLMGYRTYDSECADDAVTTDVMSTLQDAEYENVYGFFTRTFGDYVDAGLMAQRFTVNPGSDTWAYKTVVGATPQTLTSDEIDALKAKNGNYYTTIAGISITLDGKVAGGEWIDVVRGIHWLGARIQENVFYYLVTNEKVPYDDEGIAGVQGVVLAQLQAGVETRFLAIDPEPVCEVPALEDIDAADRAARELNGVTFTARVRGAIHAVDISGSLTF